MAVCDWIRTARVWYDDEDEETGNAQNGEKKIVKTMTLDDLIYRFVTLREEYESDAEPLSDYVEEKYFAKSRALSCGIVEDYFHHRIRNDELAREDSAPVSAVIEMLRKHADGAEKCDGEGMAFVCRQVADDLESELNN